MVTTMYIMIMLRMRCHKGEKKKLKRLISFKYLLSGERKTNTSKHTAIANTCPLIADTVLDAWQTLIHAIFTPTQ